MYSIDSFNTTKTTLDKAIEETTRRGLKSHHSDWIQGYIPMVGNTALIADYDGKYGKGMVVITPYWKTTSYCRIEYFVEENSYTEENLNISAIKKIRVKHGLTQKALSEITGIPIRNIQNWESESPTAKRSCPDWLPNLIDSFISTNMGEF